MTINLAIPSIEELTQNVARLLQQSLSQATQTVAPAELRATDLELARSNIKALAFVQAVGLHGAYRYLRDFVARQAIPTQSVDEFLDGWLETYSMPRKGTTSATGSVRGTGVNGSILPADTLLQAEDGRQLRVTADAVVVNGVVQAQVVALLAGAGSNMSEDTVLTLVSPVSGVDSEFTTPSGMGGGADVETDAEAVYRLQQRLASEPMGGSPADYARWALTVDGITRAWGVRNPAGPTSAGVIIMADGNPANGLPTVGQREQVLDYIRDPRRGPPDELFVIIPTLVPVDWVIHLAPDTTAIRDAVSAALADLFFREARPGGSIPHSHCTEVISSVVGEYNHTISTPSIESGGFFVVDAFNKLLVLGSVTFN